MVTAELVSVLKNSLSAECGEDVSKEEVLDTVAVLARRGETQPHTASKKPLSFILCCFFS